MREWRGAVCGVAVASLVAVPASGQWTTQPVVAPRVQYRTFQSVAAGTTVSFHVYTPPAYDTQPERRFPVLYWLHGSGSPTAGIAPTSNWFGSAMARGDMAPTIVVFPNGMPNGMYSDAADGTRPMETVIVRELIPHVDATFRTIPQRRGRMVEGFSMGGYGAGRLGFKYSELFGAASMLGAGPVQLDFMDAPPGTSVSPATRAAIYEDVWNSDPALFFAASPWNLAGVNRDEIVGGRLLVRVAVGEADAMLGPNADLHEHLVSIGIPHGWQTYPGIGHDPLPLLQAMGPSNWAFYRVAAACPDDYNADLSVNLDDLGDYITDFFTVTPIPGGAQPGALTYASVPIGHGLPCVAAPDAPPPYAVDAYRVFGYRVGFSPDESNACPLDPTQPFPNLDNLNDFITAYYASFGGGGC
jgi:enterochelin esterase-like enzyme